LRLVVSLVTSFNNQQAMTVRNDAYVLPQSFDDAAFLNDVRAAKEAVGPASEADAQYLNFLVRTTQVLDAIGHGFIFLCAARSLSTFSVIGLAVAAVALSTARCMRWTIIGHHVSHGGFDSLKKQHSEALPEKYRRGVFAVGSWRRVVDWLDWMLPEAWNVEHNKLHHYYLSEDKDPDLVERNFELLHSLPLPLMVKYVSMLFWLFTWKLTYYSPNTFKELELSRPMSWTARNWPARCSKTEPLTVGEFARGAIVGVGTGRVHEVMFWAVFSIQWLLAIAPMAIVVIFPALVPLTLNAVHAWPFAEHCRSAAFRALITVLVAEALTNAHSFVIIACNHSGEDLYRYETSCKAYSAEWFLRCAYSSANFETGTDFVDCVYGFLNYQIEHHMFPDKTPLQYRRLQPLIKSVCQKHGVMYVQQNALLRTWRMLRVAVGAASMKQCDAILHPKKTTTDSADQWMESRMIGG